METKVPFEWICGRYGLCGFRGAAELESGTASRAWRLDTAGGPYLLRTLSGEEQGEREWAVFQQLIEQRFFRVPTIFATVERESFLKTDGGCWQIQQYVEGTMPDPARPGVAAALARTAKELSQALCPLIHGDLGPWNMVQREDGALFVVDFGEAREGDPYYDYASLLGGVVNHTPGELREAVCRAFIRELNCDRTRLLEQMERWAAENTVRWAGRSEAMTARFAHALTWAKEHLYEL